MGEERWNSNLHAQAILLSRLPPGAAARGVDVGCGEGETARRLRRHVDQVVGIDPDEESIEAARAHGDDIEYVLAGLDDADLPAHGFDVVSAVAVLHHVDHRDGLTRLVDLVRPGGHLLVVGLARSASMRDYGRDALDAVGVRRHSLRQPVWETPSPKVWPPPVTYAEAQAMSLDVLPDARFERLPYFRYGLTWQAPLTGR